MYISLPEHFFTTNSSNSQRASVSSQSLERIFPVMDLNCVSGFSCRDSGSSPSGFVLNGVRKLNTRPRNWVCLAGFSGHREVRSVENLKKKKKKTPKSTTVNDFPRKLCKDLTSLPSEFGLY